MELIVSLNTNKTREAITTKPRFDAARNCFHVIARKSYYFLSVGIPRFQNVLRQHISLRETNRMSCLDTKHLKVHGNVIFYGVHY